MTPEDRIKQLENEVKELRDLFFKDNFSDLDVFRKKVKFLSSIGFFGKLPVGQQPNISNPSGGGTVDSQARTAINSILAVLDSFGFTS